MANERIGTVVTSGQLIILSILTPLAVVMLAGIIRLIVKATRNDAKLEEIAEKLVELSRSTDRRLRWLEENTWKKR